jgi:ATP synthase F1 delta subunit
MFFNTVGVDSVPKALDELMALNAVMQKSKEFRGLLENPLFTREEREKVMKQASSRLYLSDSTVKFILFLAEQMVIPSFQELIQLLTAMYLERKKRAKATVVTPVDTNRKYDEALKASLKKLTGKEVDIDYVVDPSLLGGVMVKVGSTMYDSSIKGQLRLLKDDLIKG